MTDVLYSALDVFWAKGFEATSLPDLMEATGLSKSSLYATFGSKRGLFLAAFDTYRQDRVTDMEAILNAGSGRDGVRGFFIKVVNDARSCSVRNGCMSTNQAVEMAPSDTEIQERVSADFALIESALRTTIGRGKQDGSIRSEKADGELAAQLTVAFPGIQVLVRAGFDADELMHMVNAILDCLDY